MKKRIISMLLAVLMLAAFVPVPGAGAAASYSVDKAIAYAQAHWDDGQGLCAEFVSRCVRAGGIDMNVITTTRSCINAAAKATGLSIKDLTLNSSGYATKSANGSILAKGDIVAQYCYTHDKYPHIMLCGGYNSSGIATFYAHNGALNNGKFKLGESLAYQHTKSCNMQARVLHLSSLDTGSSSGSSSGSSGSTESSTPKVSFSLPTDSTYTAKQKITNTNAVVVNKITKPSGTSVTKMGVYLDDASGNLIKKYTESVSNVGKSTTSYHSWYDINAELGVTLTPGTGYTYQFFGVFNGTEVKGPVFSFKTTGTAPAKSYSAYFHVSDSSTVTVKVTQGQPYGTLPSAEREGYTFDGWYTAETGGTRITASTVFNGSSNIDLYPHYTQNAVVQPEPEPEEPEQPVEEEPAEEFTVVFMDLLSMTSYGTYTVQNGDKYPIPSRTPARDGYEFAGWYTSSTGGTRITSSTTVNLTGDQNLYPHWTKVAEEEPESLVITLQIGSPYLYINGVRGRIDEQGTVPQIRNDRTLLPVRAVVEAMGGTVNWIGNAKTVMMKLDGKTLNLQIGSRTAWDGTGKTHAMDVEPILVNSRTMLPIRFIVEFFEGDVSWDGTTRTVTIEYTA